MRLAIIGSGYVGLVTGACFANTGNHVICADKDQRKVEMLRRGEVPIFEPGLDELISRNLSEDRLSFTDDVGAAIQASEIVFIAVGTPQDEDGSADLQHVLAVAEVIGENLKDHKIVVCKSTVPVGTCDRVREVIASKTEQSFVIVSNPEFLKEGSAIKDFQYPDRVVVGCEDKAASEKLVELYRPFTRRNNKTMLMNVRSAEMTKYASNAMLATKISFINEVARLCDRVGADVEAVRRGMAADERIGPHFIYPGVGYGGSCFPKDIRALAYLGQSHDEPMRILEAVHEVNERQKTRLVELAEGHYDTLRGKHFAIWGLAFKPRTDDVREAPAHVAIRKLVEAGATVAVTDPEAMETSKHELQDLNSKVTYVEQDYKALEGADGLFVFTEWDQYRSPDFERIKRALKQPVIFDGRNIWRPEYLRRAGFEYYCIGRPTVAVDR